MNNYQEFHRLKQQIIHSLLSIEDGSRMDSNSDNILEDKNNAETFADAIKMMEAAEKIAELLVKSEKGEI